MFVFVQIKTGPSLFLVSSYLKGTVWWWTNFKITHNRNGTRTIFQKNAMLVVVWYSHLTWKLEFDLFSFPIQTLYVKIFKKGFFCPRPEAFFGKPIPERYCLVGNSKIIHNRHGTRTILHRKCYVSNSLVFTFALQIGIWPFSFPIQTLYVKVFKKGFFGPNQDRRPFLGSPYLKGTVWWWTNFKITHNKYGTRTMLHENAMLVVV